MLSFTIQGVGSITRMARVKQVSVTTLLSGSVLDEVDITNSSQPANGAQNIVAYRPRYQDIPDLGHGSGNSTAGFFIDMEKAFPCTKAIGNYMNNPVCKMFTNEEDGFRSYRSIIEVADAGNHIRIFSPSTHDITATYGFGVQGCAEFTESCFPTHHQLMIVCYAPCKN